MKHKRLVFPDNPANISPLATGESAIWVENGALMMTSTNRADAVVIGSTSSGGSLRYDVGQSLSDSEKAQLAANWPEAVAGASSDTSAPESFTNVFFWGQSNVNTPRDGGVLANMASDPRVFIHDPNYTEVSGRAQTAIWDARQINPLQSYGRILPGVNIGGDPTTTDTPGSHWGVQIAKEIAKKSPLPVRALVSGKSSTKLEEWITTANGGVDTMWDDFLQQAADAEITYFPYMCFYHGESGVTANPTAWPDGYHEALPILLQQMRDAGFIDDKTVVMAVEILNADAHGDNIREATHDAVTKNWPLGYVVPNSGIGNIGDGIHPDGAGMDIIASRMATFLQSNEKTPRAAKSFLVPDDATMQVFLSDGSSRRIPLKVVENEEEDLLPAGYTHRYIGELFDEANATLPDQVGSDDFVASGTAQWLRGTDLVFDTGGNQKMTVNAPILPASGGFTMAIRIAFRKVPTNINSVFQQASADGTASGRFMLRTQANGQLLAFAANSSIVASPGVPPTDGSFFTVVITRDAGNIFSLSVNDEAPASSAANSITINQTLAMLGGGFSGVGTSNIMWREAIFYSSELTGNDLANLKTYLNSK